jgi:hypothetical protein
MERAAVDRKARAASLQDELIATASEIEHGHQGIEAMPGGGELIYDERHPHFGNPQKAGQRLPTVLTDALFCIDPSRGFR